MQFRYLCLLLMLPLAACTQQPGNGMKLGKPYAVDGRMYYPEYDPTYDKIGEASWYGPGFHGKYTASGEVFDQNALTAAHPTLPMPSLVRVTNIQNGRSLIVRINDRGPYAANRIIDLSKRSARELGILSTAKVRVQFLKKETDTYVANLQSTGKRTDMAQINDAADEAREEALVKSTEPPPQIVESSVNTSHAGDTVSHIAPVMSVSRDDLPRVGAKTNLSDSSGQPVSTGGGLIRQAWADDNVTMPEPPPSETADALPEVKPVAVKKPAPKKVAAKKSWGKKAGPAGLLIQVGSFATEENAHKLDAKLSGIAPLTVDKAEMDGKTWWRVRLGPFAQKEDAENALASVRAAGLPEARIVHQ